LFNTCHLENFSYLFGAPQLTPFRHTWRWRDDLVANGTEI